MTTERDRLIDIIGESDSCNDDECNCHLGARDAKDRLEAMDELDRQEIERLTN